MQYIQRTVDSRVAEKQNDRSSQETAGAMIMIDKSSFVNEVEVGKMKQTISLSL